MFSNLEKMFAKIGAKVCFVAQETSRRNGAVMAPVPVRLNIITRDKEEFFQIAILSSLDEDQLQLSVLEVLPKDRHLVLLARLVDNDGAVISKEHFLCGHDERHLFVASVTAASTVAAAKSSLKPLDIRTQERGLNTEKRNRRKTKVFRRQGEWFFVPEDIVPDRYRIRTDEPLSRGMGSKPHMAEFAYRSGGEAVMVCRQYPTGLTLKEYKELLDSSPHVKRYAWREMRRNARVYARGRIHHPDHATIFLDTWHRVLMNTESRTDAIAFLD